MRPLGPNAGPSRTVRFALVGLIAVVGVFNVWRTPPQYNWDLLPYVALAKSYDIASMKELHRATYDVLSALPLNLAIAGRRSGQEQSDVDAL